MRVRRRLLVQAARAKPLPVGPPAMAREPGDSRMEGVAGLAPRLQPPVQIRDPFIAQQLDAPLEELPVQRELVYEVRPRRPAHIPIPEQPCGYHISVRLVSDQEDTQMTPRCGFGAAHGVRRLPLSSAAVSPCAADRLNRSHSRCQSCLSSSRRLLPVSSSRYSHSFTPIRDAARQTEARAPRRLVRVSRRSAAHRRSKRRVRGA
jgi:hypothetical protein